MSIKLPSVLTVTGTVVDASATPVSSFKVRAKALAPDGTTITTVQDAGMPLEATTAADGSFSLTVKDSALIAQLLTQGFALLFKSGSDDAPETLEVGLSRTTPLHLSVRQVVSVVLEWKPKQAGDTSKPAIAAKLRVLSVMRDGQMQPERLQIDGVLVGPQEVPLKDQVVQARWVVPGTGQIVNFPQPDNRPALATSDADGRFQIRILRGGDLLPFQPYSAYALSFSVQTARTVGPDSTAEATAVELTHLSPAEPTQIKLRLDTTNPASPKLSVACVHRNDEICRPAEGRLEALGQLQNSEDGSMLPGHRIQIQAGASLKPFGEVRSNAQGYFPLPHPWPLSSAPEDVSMQWKLQVLSPDGTKVATDVALSQDGLIDAALPVKITLPAAVDSSPTIAQLLTEIKKTISAKTQTALNAANIKSVQDIQNAGGLQRLIDSAKADEATLAALEQAADLWPLLPRNVAAADATKTLAVWLGKGLRGATDIGNRPRAEGVKALKNELGDFAAGQGHAVAVARNNMLNFLLLGARIDGARAAALAEKKSLHARTLGGGASLLSEDLDLPCSCSECRTAVSPNAYLMDLLRYTYFRAQFYTTDPETLSPLDVDTLKSYFFQPFPDLPVSCDSMSTPVLTSRIAVEILRAYGATLSLDSTQTDSLAAVDTAYRQAAYAALLSELGTTTTELRLAHGDADALAALADRLAVPSATQVELLLLSSTDLLNETLLESRFGLRSSSRPPLDSGQPAADLLGWRLSRLHSAWATSDAPIQFPAATPIMDPDILDFSNLRRGWDATHASTLLWKARRTAVDGQLAALRSGRALATGAAVLAVTEPGVLTPSDDQKWAAYLSATLSDEDILSMAAKLPLDQQDQAKIEAATQNVKKARVARGLSDTLSTAETTTITTTVNYVGTGLGTATKTSLLNWMDAQFTSLVPNSGAAIAAIADWLAIQGAIKGSNTSPALATALADLARFSFATDVFLRAVDLRMKLFNQGFRDMKAEEWNEFDTIFVARWKAKQMSTWVTQEQDPGNNIKIVADLFWVSPEQPAQPKWLGDATRYTAWLNALTSALQTPIVDPALISAASIVDFDPGTSPGNLWTARQSWETSASGALDTARAAVDAAMAASKLGVFDAQVLAPALLIPNTSSSDNLWLEPDQLQASYDAGTLPAARLGQLLLDRVGFQDIFSLRSLLRGLKTTTDAEWKPALLALLKAKIRRQYGTWRAEEATATLSLSPQFFQLPPVTPLTIPPTLPNDAVPTTAVYTVSDLQRWRRVLADRIEQEASVKQAQADMIDRVEQAVLGSLRDGLVEVYADAAGFPALTAAESLTDRLLFDFLDSPSNKTTRVGQAIATLQLLLFELRSGNLFRLRTTATANKYPNILLEAEHFDSEWQWIGSYGSWRSVLFIFMYPENLLNPTLRSKLEQSVEFKELAALLRDGSSVTPKLVDQISTKYRDFILDLESLDVQATVVALVETGEANPTGFTAPRFVRVNLAKSSSGRGYFSYQFEPQEDGDAGQSLWRSIPPWTRLTQIIGAAPFQTRSGRRIIGAIGLVMAADQTLHLKLLNLDLSKLLSADNPWDNDTSELEELPSGPVNLSYHSFAVEQGHRVEGASYPANRPIYIHIGVWNSNISNPKITPYWRAINDDATGWAPGGFRSLGPSGTPTMIGDGNRLKAAFSLDTQRRDFDHDYFLVSLDENEASPFTYVHQHRVGTTYYDEFLTLSPSRYAGTQCLQFSSGSLSIMVSSATEQQIIYANAPMPSSYVTVGYSSDGTSFSFVPNNLATYNAVSAQTSFIVKYAVADRYPSGVAAVVFDLASISFSLSHHITLLTYSSASHTSHFGSAPITQVSAGDMIARKNGIMYAFSANFANPRMQLHLYEMYFAVPMQIALQLQQARYFQEALSWFRAVFDFSVHERVVDPYVGDRRKIYYGLVSEETEDFDDYVRTQNWFADPFNPHAIAALRPDSYTRFTEISIVRCLLDYADSEFAADTAESVPRARSLYLDALHLLESDELLPPEDCASEIAEMDFSFVPSDWDPSLEVLEDSLLRALPLIPPADGEKLKAAVLTALKDTTTPAWGKRFSKAQAVIKVALAAAPKPQTASEMIKSDRTVRSKALLSLLKDDRLRKVDGALERQSRVHFRRGVSAVSGVDPAQLSGNKTLKLDWLSKSVRKRNVVMDPAKRAPVLVQPSSAISRTYQQRLRWNPLLVGPQALSGQEMAAAPSLALARTDPMALMFMPSSPVSFCVPPNPVIAALRLRANLNLYKLRSGRNISGFQRQLEFYAAPTDAQTGMPSVSANGGLALNSPSRLGPTEFRYPALIERARRQVQLAAQFEGQLLHTLEQTDNQREALLRARNDLATQQATVSLKNLELQEAQLGVDLVEVQQQKNKQVQDYLDSLISEDISGLEMAALASLGSAGFMQTVAASLNIVSGSLFAAANFNPSQTGIAAAHGVAAAAQATAGLASAAATASQVFTMMAGFERRKKDWQQNRSLNDYDGKVLGIQLKQANLGVQIKQQETNIVNMQVEHAQSVVDFLVNKFTSAELYEWMSRILQGLYSAQLQQATATARLAQQQLAFDLLQNIDFILPDYWTIPIENTLPGQTSGTETTDRKGLTGSARLQRDIERLDGIAQDQTTRFLQLSRTISLATVAPGDFQRLLESGEMWFQMSEKDFDLEFPGHYFRRIHKVRVSVLALVPGSRGIRATLSNIGPSRVKIPGTVGFVSQTLPPSNDVVSLTSPQNASGLFDLDIQSELRLPFEGVGVDSLWHFELPKPANPLDYSSLADVQITFEYTAMYSPDYRAELLADIVKLPRTFQGVRVFSFRNEVADGWYALHNPPNAPADLRATVNIDASDFPAGMSNIRVRRLTVYMPISPNTDGSKVDLSKDPSSKVVGLALGDDAAPALQAFNSDGLSSAQSAADPWFRQLPARTQSPFGTWTLVLSNSQAMLDLFRADQVRDVVFAITYEADLPDWPTGLRPKNALF